MARFPQAGVGRSTSGTIISSSNIDKRGIAKGDILVYNGSSFVRLPVGADNLLLMADSSQTTGLRWSSDIILGGLPGATAIMRIAGATSSGAPVSGTFSVGDAVLSLADGKWYVCTVAGTPGTWVTPAAGGATGYRAAILATTGLVAFYRLDEPSGTTATDSSPGGRNGTYNGGVTIGAAGAVGDGNAAATFNGSTGYVNCGNPAAFQLSTATFEAWVNTTQNAATGSPWTILNKSNAYQLFVQNGRLQSYSWGGSAGYRDSGVLVNDGKWHLCHFVMQSGVTNGSRLYIDGQPAGAAFTYTISAQANSLCIGSDDTPSAFFTGSLDDIAIYNVAFTQTQIRQHYAYGQVPY